MTVASECSSSLELEEEEQQQTNNKQTTNMERNSHTYLNTQIRKYCQHSEKTEIPPKVNKTFSIHEDVAHAFKMFAAFLDTEMSELLERALVEYMKANMDKVPQEFNFTLIFKEPLQSQSEFCTVRGCKNIAIGTGVYSLRREEHQLCETHLAEFRNSPGWKILKKP